MLVGFSFIAVAFLCIALNCCGVITRETADALILPLMSVGLGICVFVFLVAAAPGIMYILSD
jgi:hypothetical protein